jgi:hypothetical protein
MTEEVVNFQDLNLKISPNVTNYPIEVQRDLYGYLSNMNEINRKAYEIAYDHLGTSFNVVRSNGFKHWKLVLRFLSEIDNETKSVLNYTGGYNFDCDHISDSDEFKKWLKNLN